MDCEKWHEQQKLIGATILRNFAILIKRGIKSNRRDIVVNDYKRKVCFLIDMAVPTDINLSVKEYNKITKYKDLEIKIEKMWHLMTTTLPIIVGPIGMTKK